jgi:hypothetical protein
MCEQDFHQVFERRKNKAGYANVERTERVPHSHSLDGGYGVKSNAKPINATNNLPDDQC